MRSQSSSPVPFSFDTWISAAPAWMPRRSKNRGSVVVMYMLILSTLITGTVASVAVLSNSETQSTSVGFNRDQAFYAAEAGIQRAIWNINHNTSAFTSSTNLSKVTTGTLYTNGPAYSLSCITSHPSWPSTLNFQCVGTSSDGAVTSQASVTISSKGSYPSCAIGGNYTASGTSTFAGTFQVIGNVTASGKLTVNNNGSTTGSLQSLGYYTSSGNYNIAGDAIFNKYITTSGGALTVGGNMQAGTTMTLSAGTMTVGGSILGTTGITSSGTVHANGDMQSGGAISISGSGTTIGGNMLATNGITSSGTVNVGGNVQAGGSITKSGTLNYGGTYNAHTTTAAPAAPALNFSAPVVDTAGLMAGTYGSVGTVTGGTKSNLILNFNATPVIEITSNATLSGTVSVQGSGTLIVNGNLTLSASIGNSSNLAPINIVTTKNLTMSGSIQTSMNGCLCVGGTLTTSGTLNLSGIMVTGSDFTGSGTVSANYSNPPAFVQPESTGASTITVSNFMGPMY